MIKKLSQIFLIVLMPIAALVIVGSGMPAIAFVLCALTYFVLGILWLVNLCRFPLGDKNAYPLDKIIRTRTLAITAMIVYVLISGVCIFVGIQFAGSVFSALSMRLNPVALLLMIVGIGGATTELVGGAASSLAEMLAHFLFMLSIAAASCYCILTALSVTLYCRERKEKIISRGRSVVFCVLAFFPAANIAALIINLFTTRSRLAGNKAAVVVID